MLRSLVGSEMCIRDRLIIEDNGIGFDEATLTHRGNGLYSMQERVSILHGNITISSSPGKGVYIDCLLYTSDAADDLLCVDLGGRRIIKKKKKK